MISSTILTFAGGSLLLLALLWYWTRSHPAFDLSEN